MTSEPLYVTVDLGGTQIRTAVCHANGTILQRLAIKTRSQEGRAAVIARLEESIRTVMASFAWSDVASIGIGAPGPLDPRRGIIFLAPNLPGWNNVPLRDIVQRTFQKPTYLGNDANVAALGEWKFGAGRGSNDMIYITVSTGIGGGIICGGQLLYGHNGLAGEVGHQTIVENGPRCNCGNRGCLEAVASGTAISREAQALARTGHAPYLLALAQGNSEAIDAALVSRAAMEGNRVAQRLLASAGNYLGIAITNLLHLFNPELIVLGGSVTKSGDYLWQPMWETVRERAQRPYLEDFDIVPPQLGDDVGLVGALALALDPPAQQSPT